MNREIVQVMAASFEINEKLPLQKLLRTGRHCNIETNQLCKTTCTLTMRATLGLNYGIYTKQVQYNYSRCRCSSLIQQEIFGPVLTVYVYPDSEAEEMLEVVNSTSVYGLTGAVFSNDRSTQSTCVNASNKNRVFATL